MKTYIWGLVGILVIVLIVLFAKGHKTVAPTTDTSDTTAPASTATTTITTTTTQPSTTMDDSTTHVRADGLGITIVKKGSGVAAKAGDAVTVNYTGRLANGTVFDSNTDPKFGHVQPFTFQLGAGMVIKGWDDGLVGAQVGEERKLSIPAALGYGASGAGASIPPNADLVFDVTITGISH